MIDKIVWIDLETTGLDPEIDQILEFAAIITDSHLDNFKVFYPVQFPLSNTQPMSELVTAMHRRSGLLNDCARSHETLDGVETAAVTWLQHHCVVGECPLGGFSPHFDRAFLRRYMPRLHAHLGHRNIDVSTLTQLTPCAHKT